MLLGNFSTITLTISLVVSENYEVMKLANLWYSNFVSDKTVTDSLVRVVIVVLLSEHELYSDWTNPA